MKDKDIEQLLESFYEGTLDEQEELELLRYSNRNPEIKNSPPIVKYFWHFIKIRLYLFRRT